MANPFHSKCSRSFVREAARFLGVSNSLDGIVDSVGADGALVVMGSRSMLCRQCGDVERGQEVSVFMRPESFRLSRRQHSEGAWVGRIEFSIYHGDCWDYHVRLDDDLLKVRVYREKVGLERGDKVFLEPDPDSAIVMPGTSTVDLPVMVEEVST